MTTRYHAAVMVMDDRVVIGYRPIIRQEDIDCYFLYSKPGKLLAELMSWKFSEHKDIDIEELRAEMRLQHPDKKISTTRFTYPSKKEIAETERSVEEYMASLKRVDRFLT